MSLSVPPDGPMLESLSRGDPYRRQLETVANNATLALFIMDERQHCTYMNPAAERLTGYTLADVQGRPLHDVVHHTRPDGSAYPLDECPIDRAFARRIREQGEEVFVHRDGHFYPVAFTASPVFEDGRAVGTIIEVRDITRERQEAEEREQLLADRERLAKQVEVERERLRQIFVHAPALMSVTRGPDHVFELINPTYHRLLGGREVIGRPLREALPEVVEQGYLALRDEFYRSGATHVQEEARVVADLDGDGEPEEHFLNFVTQPLRDADGAVDGMLTFAIVVTDQVHARRKVEDQAAELEEQTEALQNQTVRLEEIQSELETSNEELLQASRAAEEARAVLEAFIDSAPVAAAYVDRDLRYRWMNPTLAEINGIDRASAVGRSIHDVLSHSASEVEPFYRQVLATGESIRGREITVPRPTQPDEPGHYLVNYFPVHGLGAEPVGVGLVALDVTEQRRSAERERVFSQVMEESRNEIYLFDAETLLFVRVNRGARENLGYSMDELQALTPLDLKPEFSVEDFMALTEPLRRGDQDAVRFETVHLRKDGSLYPVDVHLQLSRVADRPLFVALILDITERRQAQEERDRLFEAERAARERIQILADAGTLLASSLDIHKALDELARIAVPAMADWCFVEVPTDDGRIEPIAVHHRDPERSALAREAMARYPIDPSAAHGTAKVLRTGQAELVGEIPEALLEAVARDADHLELLRAVGFRSHVSVPLTVRDRVLGVLSLVQAESGRRFQPEDLPFVEELARKAALAIDNARLFQEAGAARRRAEQEARRLDSLRRLATALNQAATLEEVARVCVVHGMDALGGKAGSLAVLADDGHSFEIIHSQGYEAGVVERWRRFAFQPGRPLSDALLQRAPLLVGSAAEWRARYPAAAEDALRGDLQSFAAIPLFLGDQPVGGLVFSFREERPFSDGDRSFLASVGAQAAQALERARLLDTERQARTEAEAANRAKAEFLSSMSHELRTPLNAIGGYVELVEMGIHGPVTDAQLTALRRVRRAQEVLLSLINDVLNFARIEAGRLEIASEPVDAKGIVEALGDLIGPQIEAKGLVYDYRVQDSESWVVGDAERIRQILVNLLSNAVKFTAPGGTIRLSAESAGDRVVIRVSDSGRGIPPDKLQTIFDPFVQIDRQRTTESQQGVGLGLAISRELARAMGGDISVESAVDTGSTFALTLPASTAPRE